MVWLVPRDLEFKATVMEEPHEKTKHKWVVDEAPNTNKATVSGGTQIPNS